MTETNEVSQPRLTTPSLIALIQRLRPRTALTDSQGDAAIDAMRLSAQTRVQGTLENSRRRRYGHAALLVASCVGCAPKCAEETNARSLVFGWVTSLGEQCLRRHAFRSELARAREGVGVSLPPYTCPACYSASSCES